MRLMGRPEEDGAPLYRWPACEIIFNVDVILILPIHILPLPSCSLVTEAWGIAAPVIATLTKTRGVLTTAANRRQTLTPTSGWKANGPPCSLVTEACGMRHGHAPSSVPRIDREDGLQT